MRLSANIMVYNESFWLKKQLEHIYDFFDEIIICEGVERKLHNRDIGVQDIAIKNNLSDDITLQILKKFKDPHKKIKFIPYGLCDNKVELTKAMYANSIGDYVWEIDADEFYHIKTMKDIKEHLSKNPDINQINFRMYHFIDLNNYIHGENGKNWGDNIPIRRIFRNEKGNNFVSHRPPTINYKTKGRVIDREDSLKLGWVMYHYGYVFDWQVNKKATYYPDGQVMKNLKEVWKKDHSKPLLYGSKTEEFKGEHPEIIEKYLKSTHE